MSVQQLNYYEFLQRKWLYAWNTWMRLKNGRNWILAMVYYDAMVELENQLCKLVPSEEVEQWMEQFFNN